MYEEAPFHKLTIRSLILWYLVSIPILAAIVGFASALTNRDLGDLLVIDTTAYGWIYGSILVWALWQCRRSRISIRRLLGGLPSHHQYLPTIGVVIPLILFSLGSLWLIYYPLSFILPGFVERILGMVQE